MADMVVQKALFDLTESDYKKAIEELKQVKKDLNTSYVGSVEYKQAFLKYRDLQVKLAELERKRKMK